MAARVPSWLLLPRPGRATRRRGLLVLALRYLSVSGGLVACAVILGAPPVLATAAGLLGALLGTAGGPMTAPVPTLPRRPTDLAGDHTLAALVDAYARHVLALAAARAAGRPADPDHLLAALAIGHADAADLAAERWSIVRDGLAHGAGHDELAAALDVDPTELAAALAAWADRQAEHGALSDDEHAAVRALAYPPCIGADDLCGAPAGQPCEPWCPSWATGGAP